MKQKQSLLAHMNMPAYQALAEEFRASIARNQYPANERLPTEDEVAKQYGLSRQTVRRAFQELTAEGLVLRVRRRGTFAVPSSSQFLRAFGSVEDMMGLPTNVNVEILDPIGDDPGPIDPRLGTTTNASTLSLRQIDNGKVILYSRIYLISEVAKIPSLRPALSTAGHLGRFSVIGLIDSVWPDGVGGVEQVFLPISASAEISALLGCAQGDSIINAERLYVDRKGRPIELAITYFHPQNYILKAKMRR